MTTRVSGKPIADIKPLTEKEYTPTGGTALLDAIGRSMRAAKERNAAGKRKVIMVIVTDGEENSSREFTHTDVMQKIEEAKLAGWQFIYLGANQDAIKVAGRLNISASYDFSPINTAQTYSVSSASILRARKSGDDAVLTKAEAASLTK